MTRHLLSVADLDDDALRSVLSTATEMHDVQHRAVKKIPTLRGRTVINLFFEDSTRTRSSFEIAGKWMSADTINITGKGSSASKGESLRDTVRTIAAMGVDAIVMRHQASGAAHQVADWFDESGVATSVLNAGDGTHEHPTQALLDAYTLERRLGSLEGKRIAIVGDITHSRVFRSNVLALPRLGAHVTVVAPPTLMPSGVTAWAAADGFALADDLDEVIDSGVDALMMLRVQRERMAGGFFPTPREYTVGYGLTRDRLAALTAHNPDAVICHPGPMNRGLEIAADAADAASSLVLDQVSAGVAVRMSVLYHLLASDGTVEGADLRREGRATKGSHA
ncbi:aspartate carbamoyltransferase catalytic subunit [Janibacter cremeus]|uniref:Aspartate carbamoyltransferase n=1 Tax=Janibacter cremeus TaxID=1285192 RepID=A0A852W1P7_9MICO|nr:aspartate carbamoyltransferase catalytic subunit [Janibacter cremeus]NYF99551.1 aspartate carbamoyltransferase catalytic subunit [Janibacter cremeus]